MTVQPERSRGTPHREQIRAYFRELGGTPAIYWVGVPLCLLLANFHGSTRTFLWHFSKAFSGHPAEKALPYLYWFAASAVFYVALPLLLSRIFRAPAVRRYGFGLGDTRAGLMITGLFLAVMLPAVAIASRFPAFASHYPLAHQAAYTLGSGATAHTSVALFVAYELGYFLYFASWEFLFRGWMLNGLLPHLGRGGAIFA